MPAECVNIVGNVRTKFFDRWTPDQENYALREANNAHRHGTRLLYPDTAPEELGWATTVPEHQAEHFDGDDPAANTIDVLIRPPGSNGMAYTIKFPYSIETAERLIRSMLALSQLMHQLVSALLLSETYGESVPTALIAPEWKPLSPQ